MRTLSIFFLDGLDDDYKFTIDIVQAHETPILFDELHEKLINRELALKHSLFGHSSFLVTANMASGHPASIHRLSNSRSTGGHSAPGPRTSF